METQTNNYLEILEVVLSQYEEFLSEECDPVLLSKTLGVIRGVAEIVFCRHFIELPFPKIRKSEFDGSLNILYESSDEEGFLLVEIGSSKKMKYMAKDSVGNTMSGILFIDDVRVAPFMFFHA